MGPDPPPGVSGVLLGAAGKAQVRREEGGTGVTSTSQGTASPTNAKIWDFQPPKPRENPFPLDEPSSWRTRPRRPQMGTPVLAHGLRENGHSFISTTFGDLSQACFPPGSPPHGPGAELGLRTLPVLQGGEFLRKTSGPRPELEEEVRSQQASKGRVCSCGSWGPGRTILPLLGS